MADAATLELFDAIEDYVARSVAPLDAALVKASEDRAILRTDLEYLREQVRANLPHKDSISLMVREAAEELLPKAIASIDVSKLVDVEVERQLTALLPLIKGEPGAAGFSPDDLEIAMENERTLVVRLRREGHATVERRLRLAIPIYRGLFKPGERNEKGDIRTYGGSSFIAMCDTDAPIGGDPPSPDWKLMSKRGRDASNA